MTQVMMTSEMTRSGRRGRVAHAEDPRQPGIALCGTRLGRNPTSAAAHRCVVCMDLARRTFVGR